MIPKAGLSRHGAAALIGLCIALYFGAFIRPGLVDQGRASLESSIDLQTYFLPRMSLGSELVFQGQLPVWNKFEYGGIPLLATGQPAALYPPKILLFGVFAPATAYWIYLIVHFAALAFGFTLFLRDRGISGVSAFVGAALCTFPVPLLDSNYHPNRIANLAWMPVLYILADRVVRGNVLAFGALALAVALQLTSGYPEFSIDIALLLSAHAIAAYMTREWKQPPWKVVPVFAVAFAAGALAASLQLLPLAELGKVAARDVLAEAGRTGVMEGGPKTPLLVVPGLIAFALIGLLVPKGRLAALGFAICAFVSGGGWRLLSVVPGFGMIRFGLTWVFLSPFFIGWAGAAGCEAVVTEGVLGSRARRAARWFVVMCGLAMAACWAVEWRRLSAGGPSPLPWSSNVGSGAAVALGIAGCAAMAVTALAFAEREAAWIASALLVTIAHLRAFPFGSPPAPFDRPSPSGVAAQLHGKPHLIRSRVLAPDDMLFGYEITDRLPSPLGVEISFMPWRYRQIVKEFGYLTMFASIDWGRVAAAPGFLDAMDVGYVVAPRAAAPVLTAAGFQTIRANRELMLLENDRHMGHAWINYAVRKAPSEADALNYVLGPEFDPRREAIVEEPTEHEYPEASDFPADPPEFEQHPRGTTEFHVNLPRPGVMVFSESAYPGRTVLVDERPAKLLRTNYVLCGVELSEGFHKVRFEYDPPSIRWGLRLSVLGAAGIVALLLYGAFGKRRTFWAC